MNHRRLFSKQCELIALLATKLTSGYLRHLFAPLMYNPQNNVGANNTAQRNQKAASRAILTDKC